MGTRSVRAAQLAVVAALTAAGLLASPAEAQEGEASITVDQAHPASGSTHYFVSVTGPDGAPITDTEVVATPIDPGGTEHEPVTLDGSGDGIYQGVVEMNAPGEWTIRFTSSNPPGTTDHVQQVGGASTETETVPPTADTTTTTEPVTTTEAAAPTPAAEDDDDGGSSALPLVLALVVLVALAILAAVLLARRARNNEPPVDPATE